MRINKKLEKAQQSLPTVISETSIESTEKNDELSKFDSKKSVEFMATTGLLYKTDYPNAISHLDLNERRLMMFLSPVVRKALDSRPKERIFYVRVQDFVKEYGIKSKNYYSELEK